MVEFHNAGFAHLSISAKNILVCKTDKALEFRLFVDSSTCINNLADT